MSIFRFLGRTMMASYFVVNGAKSLTSPQGLVAEAQPLVEAALPTIRRYAPADLVAKVPDDTATLVRINGALQLCGGLGLATGLGRRLGAAMISVAMIPHVWAATRPGQRENLLRNAALLGGALIASQDTAGKPGLAWRADRSRRQIAKQAKAARRAAGEALDSLSREISGILPE